VNVRIQWIEFLCAASRRDGGIFASGPCRPAQPDVGKTARGIEGDAAFEGGCRRRWNVVDATEQQRKPARAVSISNSVVDGERAVDGFQRAGIGVLLPFEPIERLNREEVRQPDPWQDVVRIFARCFIEEFPRSLQRAFGARIPEMPSAQEEVIGLLILRVPDNMWLRRAVVEEGSAETSGNGFGDLLLDR